MTVKSACAALATLGGLLFTTTAYAFGGACTLNPILVTGTYGFAGQGVATMASLFAPVGPVVQSGTVTQSFTGQSGATITGKWSVALTQNDSSGSRNVQFGGTFQVNVTTCQSDFYLTTPVQLATPAFHVVFVDNGNALRTVSLIPDLFIAYTTAEKL